METLIIAVFVLLLMGCLFVGFPILFALAAGFFLFFAYGVIRGNTPAVMLRAALSGVYKVRTILQIFVLIGMLTALWRAAGTIPAITYYASSFVRPGVMILMCFLLNSLISFLTGSSFASSATMGVITMSMAKMAGVSPLLAGGAILAGVYFGDRSSPVSTSALLIATLTGTDIFDNIKECMKTAVVPFVISCLVYGFLGIAAGTAADAAGDPEIRALFAEEFRLGMLPLFPAVLILILAVFRVRVIISMSVSILAAFLISLFYQHAPIGRVLPELLWGYQARIPVLSGIISGGGIRSMVNAAAIVSLSSSYAGMFELTGILHRLQGKIETYANKTTAFAAILLTSVVSTAVACNQTLAVILTSQLCKELEPDPQRFAIDIENSTAVIAAIIPWNIACAVPLATFGAPKASILLACYLYLLPVCHLVREYLRKTKNTVKI